MLGALTLNPQLKVLAENGFHDLATPFLNTEKQLARLQTVPGLKPDLQIDFSSHEGVGTTFEIRFPLGQEKTE